MYNPLNTRVDLVISIYTFIVLVSSVKTKAVKVIVFTLFSPSDVTAFHRLKYGEGGVI